MNFIKSIANSVLPNWQLKNKNLTVSRTNDSSNKEREVQDVGDEDIMYEPLLDDINAEKDHYRWWKLKTEIDYFTYTIFRWRVTATKIEWHEN